MECRRSVVGLSESTPRDARAVTGVVGTKAQVHSTGPAAASGVRVGIRSTGGPISPAGGACTLGGGPSPSPATLAGYAATGGWSTRIGVVGEVVSWITGRRFSSFSAESIVTPLPLPGG